MKFFKLKKENIFSYLRNIVKVGVIILSVVFSGYIINELVWSRSFKSDSFVPLKEVITSNILKEPESFHDEVLEYIYELRLDHPNIVFAQAIKESGNFTSIVFKENHNLFGMRVPERRATTCIGINRTYAVYSNWKASILDYALYQEAYMKNLTEEEYLKKLQRTYAEDTLYTKDLKSLMYSINIY